MTSLNKFLKRMLLTLICGLALWGCGGEGGGGNGNNNASTANIWDEMNWDQGNWQ